MAVRMFTQRTEHPSHRNIPPLLFMRQIIIDLLDHLLGALLDPLADKALLVSIFIALGIWGAIPRWIVILVVSRDIMIVGAVIVSWLFDKPVPMKPSMVSKLNTVAQVAFAALVLASLGFEFKPRPYDLILMGFVTVFTLSSVSLYLVEWVRHMSTIEA